MPPRRPPQHEIADRAIVILKSLLPRGWVAREQGGDYGIDLEIEIAQGCVTGLIFKAQVKGHGSITWSRDDSYCQSVSPASQEYWHGIPLPVILFVVDVAEEEAYWMLWAPPVTESGLYVHRSNALSSRIGLLQESIHNWLRRRGAQAVLHAAPILAATWGMANEKTGRDCFLPVSDDELLEIQWIYAQTATLREVLGLPRSDTLIPWAVWCARSQVTFGTGESFYYGNYDEIVAYLAPIMSETLRQAAARLREEELTRDNCSAKNWANRYFDENVTYSVSEELGSVPEEFWDWIDSKLQDVGALKCRAGAVVRRRSGEQ